MLLAVTTAAALATVSELNVLHKLANARFTRDPFVIVSLSSVPSTETDGTGSNN